MLSRLFSKKSRSKPKITKRNALVIHHLKSPIASKEINPLVAVHSNKALYSDKVQELQQLHIELKLLNMFSIFSKTNLFGQPLPEPKLVASINDIIKMKGSITP